MDYTRSQIIEGLDATSTVCSSKEYSSEKMPSLASRTQIAQHNSVVKCYLVWRYNLLTLLIPGVFESGEHKKYAITPKHCRKIPILRQ